MVGFCPREPGNLARDAQDLLLEDEHALGAPQDRLKRRVLVGHRLLAPIAADEVLCHAAQRGPRLEEGVGNGQILNRARPQLAQGTLRAARLALEDADRVAGLQHRASRRVVERDLLDAQGRIVVGAHHLGGVGQHGQGADAEDVHLGQADGLDVAVVELGDEKALGRPLHRHVIRQRAGRDDDAAGVHAQVVGLAQQAERIAHDRVERAIFDLLQRALQRLARAAARVRVPVLGQAAHQALGGGVVEAVRLGRLAQGRAQAQRADRRDQGDAFFAVGVADVGQHLVTTDAAKIEVDVGQAAARGVEEALEKQVVLDGVDGGDAGAVGDQRVGDAAARRDRDVAAARKAHDIGDEQEKGREAVCGDGGQFAGEPLRQRAILSRGRSAVAHSQPGAGLAGKCRVGRGRAGQVEHRPDGATVGQGGLAGRGDLPRGIQRGGEGGEARAEVVRRRPVQVDGGIAAVGQLVRREVVQALVAGDGGEQAQTLAVARRHAEDRLHGHGAQPEARGQRADFVGDGAIPFAVQFQRQPGLLAKDAGKLAGDAACRAALAAAQEPVEPAAASARQTDEAIPVALDLLPGQPAIARAALR